MHLRRRIKAFATKEVLPKVKLWLLRALVMLDGHREFIKGDGIQNFSLATVLGMDHWSEPTDEKCNWSAALRELRQIHKVAEQNRRGKDLPSALKDNLARLSSVIGLSDVDCQILEFVVHVKSEQALEDATNCLGALSSVRVIKSIAILLDLEEVDVRTSLHSRSILSKMRPT
jgi:transitional endoplasmic reticulum ATPase